VELPALRRLLQRVADTADAEISCSECFALVSRYVDLEVAGQADETTLPELRQHLRQCGVCREEYETLRDLVRLDSDGGEPAVD
jgi:hypothetical protein